MVCVICFGLFCIWGQIPNIRPPGLYSEELIIGGFLVFRIWGTYIKRGLFLEGLIFGGAYFWTFTVFRENRSESWLNLWTFFATVSKYATLMIFLCVFLHELIIINNPNTSKRVSFFQHTSRCLDMSWNTLSCVWCITWIKFNFLYKLTGPPWIHSLVDRHTC